MEPIKEDGCSGMSLPLSQITKLWVNLNSAMHKGRTVIPKAVIGDPSAVFSFVVVDCMGVLRQLSMV